jgi:hypothetical protein
VTRRSCKSRCVTHQWKLLKWPDRTFPSKAECYTFTLWARESCRIGPNMLCAVSRPYKHTIPIGTRVHSLEFCFVNKHCWKAFIKVWHGPSRSDFECASKHFSISRYSDSQPERITTLLMAASPSYGTQSGQTTSLS